MLKLKKMLSFISFFLALLFMVITIQLAENISNATSYPLSSLPIGTKIMFGSQLFTVADPSNGFIISRKTTASQEIIHTKINLFDPSDTTNVAYYLNNTYYNTFTAAQKALIKNTTWYIGNELNESAASLTAKIGLIRLSEYNALKAANYPAEASKIFPRDGADDLLLLLTPTNGNIYVHYVQEEGNVVVSPWWMIINVGIKPAFHILESTLFTYDTDSGIYFEGNSSTLSGKINDLSIGSTIMFGNEAFRLVDPAKGLMVADYNLFSFKFDADSTQIYDPLDMNNIGYYLNNTYINTFTLEQKALLKNATWYIGNKTNESALSITAKIGLLRLSEYEAVKGNNIPVEVGKIFPIKQGSYWWLLTGQFDNTAFNHVIFPDYVHRCTSLSLDGIRPAIQIIETTNVASINGQTGVYMLKSISSNTAPTDIALSNNSISENLSLGTTVGILSRIDPDTADTATYALVAGAGSTDNASFSITGTSLKTARVFNFEAKNSYSIRIRVTDTGGLWCEKVFTISIIDVLLSEASNIIITPVGGNVIPNTLNTTNTHMKATAVIVAGQATGGRAELLIDGVVKLTDNTITATDTLLQFDTSDVSPTNAELQTAIPLGGVVSIKLIDNLGNAEISSIGNPTLLVDYNKPWANDTTIVIDEDTTSGWQNLDCGDLEGELLTMSTGASSLPGGFGTNGITSYWYNPSLDWNGLAWFEYKVDGSNGNTSELKTVYIVVNPVNDLPTISNKTVDIFQDTVLTFDNTIFSGYNDIDGDPLAKIKITALPLNGNFKISGIPIVLGQVIDVGDITTIEFQPDIDWFGVSSFKCKVSDGTSYSILDAIITINVISTNNPPIITSSSIKKFSYTFSTNFNSQYFTRNFTDADGDTLQKIQITSVPTLGTLLVGATIISNNDEIDFSQLDQLKYTNGNFSTDRNIDESHTIQFKWRGFDGEAYSNETTFTLELNKITLDVE